MFTSSGELIYILVIQSSTNNGPFGGGLSAIYGMHVRDDAGHEYGSQILFGYFIARPKYRICQSSQWSTWTDL